LGLNLFERRRKMAKRYPLKITVIKKLSAKEVYGYSLPEVADDFLAYCDRLEVGKEFVVEESGAMPSGFCTWAWHDIYPAVTGLRFGGNYPWMRKAVREAKGWTDVDLMAQSYQRNRYLIRRSRSFKTTLRNLHNRKADPPKGIG
jgi:uncharacterized repeat protein (TIGR04076 family)